MDCRNLEKTSLLSEKKEHKEQTNNKNNAARNRLQG